jgi:hypothetical protein
VARLFRGILIKLNLSIRWKLILSIIVPLIIITSIIMGFTLSRINTFAILNIQKNELGELDLYANQIAAEFNGLGQEAGHAPVNARTEWDAGVVLGYCTDTGYDPLAGLDHELKILSVMFSMEDLIKMMGPNSASYIQMSDDLGELAAGKLADIILIDGDPLAGYWEWLKTRVVIKEGKVVVDKR